MVVAALEAAGPGLSAAAGAARAGMLGRGADVAASGGEKDAERLAAAPESWRQWAFVRDGRPGPAAAAAAAAAARERAER